MNFDLILLDIETQQDFFLPSGSCYTSKAETARYNIYKLFDWARSNDQPVISTVLRLPPGQIGPLAEVPHCIENTRGEKKLSKTILPGYLDFGLRGTTDLPPDLFDEHRQVIFEKRSTDIFEHRRAERLLTELQNVSFVLCGAGISGGIVEAAIGLRSRGFGVILASDAAVGLNAQADAFARKRMLAKGVLFVETGQIIAPRPNQVARAAFRSSHGALQE